MDNILLTDRDGTLGDALNQGRSWQFYPGAVDFIQRRAATARIYPTTRSLRDGKQFIAPIENVISGYFAGENVSPDGGWYFNEQGEVKRVLDNFVERKNHSSYSQEWNEYQTVAKQKSERIDELNQQIHLLVNDKSGSEDKIREQYGILNREIQRLKRELIIPTQWTELVHQQTEQSLAQFPIYENPYGAARAKDLYLVKLQIDPKHTKELRTVHLGDNGEYNWACTDPLTPVVIKNPRERNWGKVDVVLDALFADQAAAPWQVFDTMYASALGEQVYRQGSLGEVKFRIEVPSVKGRILVLD